MPYNGTVLALAQCNVKRKSNTSPPADACSGRKWCASGPPWDVLLSAAYQHAVNSPRLLCFIGEQRPHALSPAANAALNSEINERGMLSHPVCVNLIFIKRWSDQLWHCAQYLVFFPLHSFLPFFRPGCITLRIIWGSGGQYVINPCDLNALIVDCWRPNSSTSSGDIGFP